MRKLAFIALLITILAGGLVFWRRDSDNDHTGDFPPRLKNGQKWVIGYLQSGKSEVYNSSLKNFIDKLAEKGWLVPLDWKNLPADSSAREIWGFIADNIKSRYLLADKKNFWSFDWNIPKRRMLKKKLMAKLSGGQIDLMLAMGTWAGQDLAGGRHSVPTLCFDSSYPIKKVFEKAGGVPEHFYVPYDPEFLLRQIRLFRRITKFKRLGVVYIASSEGRARASLTLLKQLSNDEKFELVSARILPEEDLKSAKMLKKYISTYEKLAPQVDAMWLSSDFLSGPKTASQVLAPLFKYKIPTWYPHGAEGVANGAIFGVINDPRQKACYYADIAVQIFHGRRNKVLNRRNNGFKRQLVINYAAAEKVDLKISKTLLAVAGKSYLAINTGEKR